MVDTIGAAKYLREGLDQHDETWYDTEYPELWGANGRFVPSTPDLDIAVKRVIASRIDYVGEAAIYDGTATDFPLSDFGIESDSFNVRIVVAGQKWSTFDVLAAERQNKVSVFPQLDWLQTKMEAMRMSIDKKIHNLVAYGDNRQDMDGFLSCANVDVVDVDDDIYDPALDPNDVYELIRGWIQTFKDETELVAGNNLKLVVPSRVLWVLGRRFNENSDGTPLNLLRDENRGLTVQSVDEINEAKCDKLKQFGIYNYNYEKDRVTLYTENSRAIKRQYYPLERTEPETIGLEHRVIGYCATTEVQNRQPFKMRYFDIPKYEAA